MARIHGANLQFDVEEAELRKWGDCEAKQDCNIT